MSKDKVNVCWILGGFFQRKKLIDSIANQISNAETVYMPEDATGEEVQRLLRSSDEGIFDVEEGNRIVVLGHLPTFSNTKQPGRLWSKILSDCPSNCVVVFNNVSKYESSSLFKLVKKIGKVFEYDHKISTSDAITFAESYIEEDGKKINSSLLPSIVDRIKEDKKVDSDLLYINLVKLSGYLGSDKEVTKEDIFKVVNKNVKFTIWDWFDLVDKKDYTQLMIEFIDLKTKEKPSQIIAAVLPVFRWRFKLMLLVKSYKDSLKDSNKVLKAMSGMKKITKKENEEEFPPLYSDFTIRGILYGRPSGVPPVEVFNKVQLVSILRLIDGFLLKTRDGATEVQSELMLQTLFMFICGKGDTETIKNLRNYLID